MEHKTMDASNEVCGCILALDILFFKSGSWDGVMEWSGLSFFWKFTLQLFSTNKEVTGKQNVPSQSPLYGIRVEANTPDSGGFFSW